MPTPTRVTWRFYPELGPFAIPSQKARAEMARKAANNQEQRYCSGEQARWADGGVVSAVMA
eukprot:2542913-Rhodomonas_salina.1